MTYVISKESDQPLSALVDRVANSRERIAILRRKRIVAALVSAEDLELLKRIDRMDLRSLTNAERTSTAKGGRPVPWDAAKKQIGL